MIRIGYLLALSLLLPASAFGQACIDGMAGVYPCQNVDLLAQAPGGGATDIWGWTDPDTGVEYAIIFINGRTTFVDLSEPTAPVVVGQITTVAGKDGRTYGNHFFVVDDGGVPGIAVFDLTRLRDVTDPPVDFSTDALYTGLSRAHNIDLDTASGFAYPVSVGSSTCSGALHIVDVRDPLNPAFAGCFDSAPYTFHDTHCVTYDGPDADYQGDEVCFGSSGGGGVLSIVNVTDKANPTLIAESPYPNPAYTHQGWLTEDGRYFLANDEGDEISLGFNTRTLVFDVEDLDDPQFAFAHLAETTSTDHNLFVKGDYAYQANYTSGLRVLDLAGLDDDTLTEVAFFDTSPNNSDFFGGSWGTYPFFDSGIVIVSDMSRGLFVLRPTLDTTTDAEAGPGASGKLTLSTYPNPFTDATTIELRLSAAQHVSVVVYDVLGRRVAELFDGVLPAGEAHQLDFDARALPAGTYVVRTATSDGSITRVVTRAQ